MKIISFLFSLLVVCFTLFSCHASRQAQNSPALLPVGYSLPVKNMTPEKLAYAKSVGIDYVEVSFSEFIDTARQFKWSEAQIIDAVTKAKKAADEASIKVWSIHMPYGKNIDISLANENDRQQVVELHKKVLQFVELFKPSIILFHPSWYLGLNERELRTAQMIKSSNELVKAVNKIGADMVIENMLGPQLQVDAKRERPLCRSVEETVAIMNRLPNNIYSAVDMNHIKNPENLIRAMGKRLKSVHIADGHGDKESHFLPCSGEGGNNWNAILAALEAAGYTGPFMYESKNKDVKELRECYLTLYNAYQAEKSKASL